MSQLVTSHQEVLENIIRFERELEKSHALQNRLSQARAWYAYKDDGDLWHFGPSKFVGYRGMTAKEYMDGTARDGRRTEKQLRTWFVEVDESDSLFEPLNEQLHNFLDGYLKVPSVLARLMVLKNPEQSKTRATQAKVSDGEHLLELLIAVARQLPQRERDRLKASI